MNILDYNDVLSDIAKKVTEVTNYPYNIGWPASPRSGVVLVQFSDDGDWLTFEEGFRTALMHTRLMPLLATNDQAKAQENLALFIQSLNGMVGQRLDSGEQCPIPIGAGPISTLMVGDSKGFLTSAIRLSPVRMQTR